MFSRKQSKKKSFRGSGIIKPTKLAMKKFSFTSDTVTPRLSSKRKSQVRGSYTEFTRGSSIYSMKKIDASTTEDTSFDVGKSKQPKGSNLSRRYTRTSTLLAHNNTASTTESDEKASELQKKKKHFIQSPTGGDEDETSAPPKKRHSIRDSYSTVKTLIQASSSSSQSVNTEMTTRDIEINRLRDSISGIMNKCDTLKEERNRLKQRKSSELRKKLSLKVTESEEEVIQRLSNSRGSIGRISALTNLRGKQISSPMKMTETMDQEENSSSPDVTSDPMTMDSIVDDQIDDGNDEINDPILSQRSEAVQSMFHPHKISDSRKELKALYTTKKSMRSSTKRLINETVQNVINQSVHRTNAGNDETSVSTKTDAEKDELLVQIDEQLAQIKHKDMRLSEMNQSLNKEFLEQNDAEIKLLRASNEKLKRQIVNKNDTIARINYRRSDMIATHKAEIKEIQRRNSMPQMNKSEETELRKSIKTKDSEIEQLKSHINEINSNMEELRTSTLFKKGEEDDDESKSDNEYLKKHIILSQEQELNQMDQIQELKEKLAKSENENKILKTKYERQSKQIVKKNQMIQRSIDRQSMMRLSPSPSPNLVTPLNENSNVLKLEKIRISENKLDEKEEIISKLTNENKKLRKMVIRMNRELNWIMKQGKLFAEDIGVEKIEEMLNKSKHFQGMMKDRDEREKKMKQQIAKKNQMIQDAVERHSQIVAEHKHELEEVRRQSSLMMAKRESQHENERVSVEELKSNNQRLSATIVIMDKKINENQRLSQQNIQYAQKMIIMDKRITQKDSIIGELKKQINEMEEVLDSHRRKSDNAIAATNALKSEMNEKEIKIKMREDKYYELKEKYANLKNENHEIKGEMSALKEKVRNVTNDITAKHERIVALESKCNFEIKMFKENEQILVEKNEEIRNLKQTIAGLMKDIDETKLVIATLNDNNNALKQRVSGEFEKMKNENQEKTERITDLEHRLADKEEELEKEEELNENLNRELDELEQSKRDSKLDDEEIKQLTQRLSELESALNEKNADGILLKQQIMEKNEIIAEKNGLIEEEIRKSDSLKIDLSDEKAKEEEIEQLIVEVKRLSEQKQIAEHELIETDKIFKQRFIEFKQMQAQNEDLKNKLEKLSNAISKKDEIIDRLQEDTAKIIEKDIRMIKDMEHEKEELSARHTMETARISKDIIDSKDALMNDLKERLKESHQSLKEKDIEISNMNDIIRHLQEENKQMVELPDIISKHEAELWEKGEKLSKLQNEKKELIETVNKLERKLIECEQKRADEHTELKQSFDEQTAHKSKEIEELHVHISQLNTIERQHIGEISELSEKVNERDGEIQTLRQKLKKKMKDLKAMQNASAEHNQMKEAKIKLMDEKIALMDKKGLKMKQVIKELKAWSDADIVFKDEIIRDLRNQIVGINDNMHRLQVKLWKAEGRESEYINEKQQENQKTFDMDVLNEWMVKLNEELEELRSIKKKRNSREEEEKKEEIVIVVDEKSVNDQ